MTEPIAATTAGKVRGEANENGLAFQGIPYAAPPVGKRRFRPAERPERWDGIRDCTSFAGRGEDCLYLNVWTPGLDAARRAVMLWAATPVGFHGQAFARDGVVLVTATFRRPVLIPYPPKGVRPCSRRQEQRGVRSSTPGGRRPRTKWPSPRSATGIPRNIRC